MMRTAIALAVFLSARTALAACSGSVIPVENCGASGGAKSAVVSTVTGSHTLTSGTGTWALGDVGKVLWCVQVDTAAVDVAMTTITTFTDSAHVIVGSAALQTVSGAFCVWGTQDDTTAFESANAAATPVGSDSVRYGRFGGPASTVSFCGGYIVSANVFQHLGNGPSPSFKGCDEQSAVLFLSPSTDLSLPIILMVGPGGEVSSFTLTGMGLSFTGSDVVRFNQAADFTLRNVSIRRVGGTDGGPVLNIAGSQNATISQVTVQDAPAGSHQTACTFDGDGAINTVGLVCSNYFLNLIVENNASARGPDGVPLTFTGGFEDECFGGSNATTGCTVLKNGGYANFIGTTFFSPNTLNGTPAISVDLTSRAWFTDCNAGQFSSEGNGSALYIASGSKVVSSGTTWRANGNAAAITTKGMFIDAGGNDYLHCFDTSCTQLSYTAAFSNPVHTVITPYFSTWGVLAP